MATDTIWVSAKVHPTARKDMLVSLAPGRVEVWVKAKPLEGQANDAVAQLLAAHWQVPRHQVQLMKGRLSPFKLFKIVTRPS